MNEISLRGTIKNIEYSHTINGIEYNKADLIVPKENGQDDVLSLRFKKFSNFYKNDDVIELIGNIRSYSRKLEDGKNKVDIYVFTYFDLPYEEECEKEFLNDFEVDGRICKIDEMRVTKNGKQNLHFTLANNIINEDATQKINNYLPCVVWGKNAIKAANLKVNDKVYCHGELHSRLYKKLLDNGEFEFRVAHELVIVDLDIE